MAKSMSKPAVSGARWYPRYSWFHLLFAVHPHLTPSFQLTHFILLQVHISKASSCFLPANDNVQVSAAYKTAPYGTLYNSFPYRFRSSLPINKLFLSMCVCFCYVYDRIVIA